MQVESFRYNALMDQDLFSTADDALDAQAPQEKQMAQKKSDKPAETAQESGALAFESSFARLEEIVAEMERGDLPLEDLLGRFEEGVGLVRHCQKFLEQAQLRVAQFVEQKDGQWILKNPDH